MTDQPMPPVAQTLRRVVEGRLDVYERAAKTTEDDLRRAVARIDGMATSFIVTDYLLRLAERHRLLTALAAELRDILKCQEIS